MEVLIKLSDAINALQNNRFPGAPYVDAGISIAIGVICDLPSAQPDITRLSQAICTKTCKITDTEGLQHEVIHYGDLKDVIFEVMGWMI